MTPIGHISISILAGKKFSKNFLTGIIIGGILPDLDWALVIIPGLENMHRIAGHNIFYVIIAGLITYLMVKQNKKKAFTGGIIIGCLLHLLADSFFDNNPLNGTGIYPLWPLSNQDFLIANLSYHSQSIPPAWSNFIERILYMLSDIIWDIFFAFLTTIVLFWEKIKDKLYSKVPLKDEHSVTSGKSPQD